MTDDESFTDADRGSSVIVKKEPSDVERIAHVCKVQEPHETHWILSAVVRGIIMAICMGVLLQIRPLRVEMETQTIQLRSQPTQTDDFSFLFSSSKTTEAPTGHSQPGAGGAIYDDSRRMIVSTSWDMNKGRDIYITRFGENDPLRGTTKVYSGVIPFSTGDRAPITDGKRYVYFMEHTWEDNGKKFGRLDLDNLDTGKVAFESLKALDTGKKFSIVFSGCYHEGKIYAVQSNGGSREDDNELIEYDIKKGEWASCGVKLFTGSDHKAWRLLSDPQDKECIYVVNFNKEAGLYRINLTSRIRSLVALAPSNHQDSDPGTYDCLLVRENPNYFFLIAVFDNSWYCYSSYYNRWASLPWKKPNGRNGWNYNYLVYSSNDKVFYYHSRDMDKWESVQLW